jgi:hypothetical protein
MARKFCPACKSLKGASATTCECGHVFDASTIVQPPTPKLCPFCGAGNPQNAHTCHCGRHFDLDANQTRAVIVRGRNRGAVFAVLGAITLVAEIALAVFGGFVSAWLFLGSAALLSGGIGIAVNRANNLRIHDAKQPQLPVAKVQKLD